MRRRVIAVCEALLSARPQEATVGESASEAANLFALFSALEEAAVGLADDATAARWHAEAASLPVPPYIVAAAGARIDRLRHNLTRSKVSVAQTAAAAQHRRDSGGASEEAPRSKLTVFVSYSHRDREWLEQFQIHLKPYLRAGSVQSWDDTKIKPSDEWRREIDWAVSTSSVAVLLVSPHFLDSEFIVRNELPPLLDGVRQRGGRVVWIPLSASSFEETEIAKYQAAIDPQRPLDTMPQSERNAAWVRVCKMIKSFVAQ